MRRGRVASFLRREGWVIAITLFALLVRLFWNIWVHPPREHVVSDMQGYFVRAAMLVEEPLSTAHEELSFYPWGTHALLGALQWLFVAKGACPRAALQGRVIPDACSPMDIGLAVVGAVGVMYTTLIARRLLLMRRGSLGAVRPRWLYIAVGLLTALYYPLLALTGYYLSEGPFFAGLAAAAFHSLRLADEGKKRDALLFGLFAGLAAIVRPQALMSVAVLGVFWLFRRRQLRGATFSRLALAGLPLALILAFSAVRTTRHLRQRDKTAVALVSTNDALNYAFGRCHATTIEARDRGSVYYYGPPSLGSLHFGVERLRKEGYWVPLGLEPALPPDPQCEVNKKHKTKNQPAEPCVLIRGRMWDRPLFSALADACVKQTGLVRQIYFAATHVVMSFGTNVTWPDSSQRRDVVWVFGVPFTYGASIMLSWQIAFGVLVVPLALLAVLRSLSRRRAREGLLAAHIWACVIVSMLYFGETRLRTPYDFLLLLLAAELWARLLRAAARAVSGLGTS